ncbi:MAG: Holliday junction branch migration protein RuvA, partial [Spirochaetales bacterium]|nr:Holliday junction branch migration protein RuvA [Spirochaetales bacterium]
LSRIPGLGKKTAQKIILTLRGRLTAQGEEESETPHDEIVTALVDMGFDRQSAAKTVDKCAREVLASDHPGEEHEKEIFRRSIVALSSNQ